MADYTATSIGLSEAASGAANRSAYEAFLAGTAAEGDILFVNGFFDFTIARDNLTPPSGFTLRSATAGATDQGFNIVGTQTSTDAADGYNWYAFDVQDSFVQGLKFTASEAPAFNINFANNNPQPPLLHKGTILFVGSHSIVEYCDISGTLDKSIELKLNTDNITIRKSRIQGARTGLAFAWTRGLLVDECYFYYALVDNIKLGLTTNQLCNNNLIRNSFFIGARDSIDVAGNYTNLTINDCVMTRCRIAGIDSKTSVFWGPNNINRYLNVNRCRFVDCRRAVATDYLDAVNLTNAQYIAGMPRDFIFTDCSYEVAIGSSASDWYSNWLHKGGDYFTVIRPKYYGDARQGFSFSRNTTVHTPPTWFPENLDDGDASKQVFAARAVPTMDLEVGPAFFTGSGGAPNVAPVLTGVAINPNGGVVGTVLGPVYTLNSDVSPAPTITFAWKRGATTVATSQNYTSQAADVGEDITLTMTASNVAGTSSPAASAAVAITAASTLPAITGNTLTLLATAPT